MVRLELVDPVRLPLVLVTVPFNVKVLLPMERLPVLKSNPLVTVIFPAIVTPLLLLIFNPPNVVPAKIPCADAPAYSICILVKSRFSVY